MPSTPPTDPSRQDEERREEGEDEYLAADDALEEVADPDEDQPMSDAEDAEMDEPEEIQLQNDSAAYFDTPTDSLFCIAQHPIYPHIVVTGGGDDKAYVFDATPPERPVLPASYESGGGSAKPREGLKAIQILEGHTDSVNAVAFTEPKGEYILSAGLDGRLRAWRDRSASKDGTSWAFVAETQEVQEINWLAACPHENFPNTVALGASDGSVWIYAVNAEDAASPLTIVQAFYMHTESSTAGAWTPDGKLLATVSEDASLYVWDAFGDAAAAGIAGGMGGQAVVGLTAEDQRFAVEGGLYSVAVNPAGTFAAVGGAGGNIRIVGLPRIGAAPSSTAGVKGGGAKSKTGGAKKSGGPSNVATSTSAGQAGQILASLQAQSDGVETLSFSLPPLTLLAAGSVDGSIALFDMAHRFAVRRHIREAHEEFAVVKVDFVKNERGAWLLTSCGMDGVVRRWDTRGGTGASGQGLVKEWKGHRGEGEGGGVLGFVQGGGGSRVVTAGDDGVSLVFEGEF